VVNLPTIASPYGGLGVNFGRIFGKTLVQLDAEITALEDAGKGRIISSPKIVAMNNKEAVIQQGEKIPVTTRTPDGTFSTTYRDASLKLTVIPRTIPNLNRLSLSVKLEDTKVLDREDILGNPHLATKEAVTEMLLDSGETMVIGGIAATEDASSERRVPCLGTVPVLGEAFKARNKTEDKRELLMFITATIMNDQTPAKAQAGQQ
jgi:type IV pilus assembly protein PilQ